MAGNETARTAPGYEPRAPRYAYSGANDRTGLFRFWRPELRSADQEILREGAVLRARARDLERNHPFAQGVVRTARIGVIGKHLRYSCRPDWRFLGIDQEEAIRWGSEWERIWESYAHSYDAGFDAGRRMNFTQFMMLAHDADFIDGEFLIAAEWDPSRRWNSCWAAIDVDRLSQPHGARESQFMRGGVELGAYGEPLAYHIRTTHPTDYDDFAGSRHIWERKPRVTEWGRPVLLHGFDMVRAGQTRGRSHLAAVATAMHMGTEYFETALQAAILQTSYAAVVESEANHRETLEAINMSPAATRTDANLMTQLSAQHLEAAAAWHEAVNVNFNGVKVPILYPNEKMKLLTPGTQATSLGDFQAQMARAYAAGTGTDSIAVSADYSRVNYSSAKMAAATTYRGFETRRQRFIQTACMPIVGAVLEEAVHAGAVDLPKGLSRGDFYAAKDALICGTFLAQGAPNLDPTKEAQALQQRLQIGLDTLRDAAAAEGQDWRDILDQRAIEKAELMAVGLGDPLWMMQEAEAAAEPEGDAAAEPEAGDNGAT